MMIRTCTVQMMIKLGLNLAWDGLMIINKTFEHPIRMLYPLYIFVY